jgi:hypothetical protein
LHPHVSIPSAPPSSQWSTSTGFWGCPIARASDADDAAGGPGTRAALVPPRCRCAHHRRRTAAWQHPPSRLPPGRLRCSPPSCTGRCPAAAPTACMTSSARAHWPSWRARQGRQTVPWCWSWAGTRCRPQQAASLGGSTSLRPASRPPGCAAWSCATVRSRCGPGWGWRLSRCGPSRVP